MVQLIILEFKHDLEMLGFDLISWFTYDVIIIEVFFICFSS